MARLVKVEDGRGASSSTSPFETGNQNAEQDLGNVEIPFSFRKPRDVWSGASSGLKNVLKGVGIALVALIGAPILGAKEKGIKGAIQGLGVGLASTIIFPAIGAVSGGVQLIRGVFNTPKAVKEKYQNNKIWDNKDRRWIIYSLQKEAELVLNESEAEYIKRIHEKKSGSSESEDSKKVKSKQEPVYPSRQVKDKEFYDILGVSPSATSGQIKKGYYQMARKLHPDKNRNDPNANERFQKVGAAYQVLSDPVLRDKYDRLGKDGVEDTPMIDSSALYMMIFGSEKFEFYVGELKLAMMMLAGEETQEEDVMNLFSSDTLNYKQGKREVQCTVNLAKLLKEYTPENEAQFNTKIETEAKELASTALGGALLAVVGHAYVQHAKIYLGFKYSIGAGLGVTSLQRRSHVINTQIKLFSSAVNGYRTAKKQGLLNQPEGNEENIGRQQLEGFLIMIDTLWRVSVIDVETTVGRICTKLFADQDVAHEVKVERAKGLLAIGRIFRSHGTKIDEGLVEIKTKLQTDFDVAMAQAGTQQETTKETTKESTEAVKTSDAESKSAEVEKRSEGVSNSESTTTKDESKESN